MTREEITKSLGPMTREVLCDSLIAGGWKFVDGDGFESWWYEREGWGCEVTEKTAAIMRLHDRVIVSDVEHVDFVTAWVRSTVVQIDSRMAFAQCKQRAEEILTARSAGTEITDSTTVGQLSKLMDEGALDLRIFKHGHWIAFLRLKSAANSLVRADGETLGEAIQRAFDMMAGVL